MKQHIVYCYTSPSGKKYIGITSNEKKRKWEHRYYARKGIGFSFHQAIRKYGWNTFKYEVLCYVSSRETACLMEKALIKEFNTYYNGYNNTLGGDGIEGFRLGEDSPLAKPKEFYNFNSVERHSFKISCENKSWFFDDFHEIVDYVRSNLDRKYYFYIYKHNKKIITNYNEIETFVNYNTIANKIISVDRSVELCDLSQYIWSKCYSVKDFSNLAENMLVEYYNTLKEDGFTSLCIDDMELEDVYDIEESTSFMNVILDIVKKQDELIYKCLYYYFVENRTYKEIASIVNISFRGVKNKIDKGLEMLREYYKS